MLGSYCESTGSHKTYSSRKRNAKAFGIFWTHDQQEVLIDCIKRMKKIAFKVISWFLMCINFWVRLTNCRENTLN